MNMVKLPADGDPSGLRPSDGVRFSTIGVRPQLATQITNVLVE